MEFDPFILAAMLEEEKKRNMWVRPIFQTRNEESEYHTMFEKLKSDDEKFQNYTRMTLPTFNDLLVQ